MLSEHKYLLRSAKMAKQLTEAEQVERDELFEKHSSASRCVWTYNMLQALDNGVKGKRWFSLKDKICRQKTLRFGFTKVSKNKGGSGVDSETIEIFKKQREGNLDAICRKLIDGTFQPLPVKRVYIDKSGSKEKRPLGIPTIRQRIVENAFKFALEPIFEREFLDSSFGFRPGRSAKDALRVVSQNLDDGYIHVVDADIKGYFDKINHNLLMSFVEEHIADSWVLNYLKRFLRNDIMDTHKRWTPVEGSPQGSVISPLLSNIYLHKLDCRMTKAGYKIIRYADDFVVMCKTKESAELGLELIKEVMKELKLTLHPEKTKVVEVKGTSHFNFLGYFFAGDGRGPRRKSRKSLKDKIKSNSNRSQGKSIQAVIDSLNPILRGWYNYCKYTRRYKFIFSDIDQFIRRRLRSILAKFKKKKGSHRMVDNFTIPNKFFHKLGLFSLQKAHLESVALERGNL